MSKLFRIALAAILAVALVPAPAFADTADEEVSPETIATETHEPGGQAQPGPDALSAQSEGGTATAAPDEGATAPDAAREPESDASAEADETASGSASASVVNPLYEGLVFEGDVAVPQEQDSLETRAGASFNSEAAAVEYLTDRMVARNSVIEFQYTAPSALADPSDYSISLFNKAVADKGGNPAAGDYLDWHWGNYGTNISWRGTTYTFTYRVTYYTTAAQEEMVSQKANAVLSELDLVGKSPYQKIKLIHDWVCKNVRYDYDNLHNSSYIPMYTAYGALIDGKSVCQGYASAFYRLCREANVPVRIVTGAAWGGPHGWNIVKIGDRYYNIDTTGAAPYLATGEIDYQYFLKSPGDFTRHIRQDKYDNPEFHAAYPMAATSYDPASDPNAYKSDLSDGAVAGIADQTYTGSPITPSLTVTLGRATLSAGSDYTVSITSNTNAGIANVTVTGTGSYTGSLSTVFSIRPASLASASIAAIPDQAYTGSPLKPEPTITFNGRALAKGTDYTLSYKNNRYPNATAQIIATGTGNFSGSASSTFAITGSATGGSVDRIAGANRYATSSSIVTEALKAGSYQGVIIARADSPYDSLSAAGLSGVLNYPILLTHTSYLTSETAAALAALKAANGGSPLDIIVAGDGYAVSDNVCYGAGGLSSYGTVDRRFGDNRFTTAEALYDLGKARGGWNRDVAIVATGTNFADALSISPYAASRNAPIFLASNSGSKLSSAVEAELAGYSKVIILGDTYAVTRNLEQRIKSLAGTTQRLSGSDRYETCVKIMNWEIDQGMSLEGVGFATGSNFPDALASGFLLGLDGSVLCLVQNGSSNASQKSFIAAKNGAAPITNVRVFGDKYVVSNAIVNDVKAILGW